MLSLKGFLGWPLEATPRHSIQTLRLYTTHVNGSIRGHTDSGKLLQHQWKAARCFVFFGVCFWPGLILDTWRRGYPCCLLFIYDETYTGNLFFSIKSHPGGTSCSRCSLQGRDVASCTLSSQGEGGLSGVAGTAAWKGSHVWRRAQLAVLEGGCALRVSSV